MRLSQINFAPRSLRTTWHCRHPGVWALGAIGVALCISASFVGYDLIRLQSRQKQEIDQIRLKYQVRNAAASPQYGPTIAEAQIDAVNGIIDRLNIPWGQVFRAIESATPANIALLELAPDAKRHAIKATAEAKSMHQALDYIELLSTQSFFESVVLLHHEINEQDVNKPVRFQFLATWEGNIK